MRATIQLNFICTGLLITLVSTSGCVNSITGDLGDLFSESPPSRALDSELSTSYKLDPLALRSELPETTPESTSREQSDMDLELFRDLPSMDENQIAHSENDFTPASVNSAETSDTANIPTPGNDFVPNSPMTSLAANPEPKIDESGALQPVIRVAQNPLEPRVPVDIAPFESSAEDSKSFRPLPPTKPPEKQFVSEQMTQLVPPFANHPEPIECEYELCDSDIEFGNEFAIQTPVSLEVTDPATFVNDLVDRSMDPNQVNQTAFVATPKKPTNFIEPKAVIRVEPEPKPLTWDEQLEQSVSALQSEMERSTGERRESLENATTVLRTLHSNLLDANGQQSVPVSVKKYWLHQISALKHIIDHSIDDQNVSLVTTATLQELKLAANALRESADLRLNSSAFCRKVIGFGQYELFGTTNFKPNQPVLVYCEIENFTPTVTLEDGHEMYETRISSSYSITDENGQVVQSMDFPMVTDEARKLRNDFFMHLPIRFVDLRIGDYELQVEVHDYGSGKKARLSSPLRFSIH